ncbi:MAG: response regulator transcription factor [Fibrobacteres bacterium]|nr:response regulator transcription factor [Fibrobacterota bacterium]
MSGQQTEKAAARILIVDDHPVVRQGLKMALGQAGFFVCGEAEGMADAMSILESAKPDLILADLDLEGASGIDLIKAVKETHPDLPVLVLSMHDEDAYAERALRAGARGYLMKHSPPERLAEGVRQALAGEIILSESMKRKILLGLAGRREPAAATAIDKLTDRELEVFRLLGEGMTTRRIAERLSISVKTVEAHIAHLKSKLGAESGRELQHRAYSWSSGGKPAAGPAD